MKYLSKIRFLSPGSFLPGSLQPGLLLLGCLLFTSGYLHAAVVNISNGTLTTFDAISGDLTFDWDLDSAYDITGTDVILTTSNLATPGAGYIGTFYEFIIPNFYDGLPIKKIDISMHGSNASASGFALPSVLSIVGADSDFTSGGPALPVIGAFVSGTTSPTLVTEYWEMFPNPDFETVDIYVPAEFGLQYISIATQSTVVPVPASIWLFGSGIIGLFGLVRRNRK